MDALVMAGGRGTRLEADVEKPLFEVDGVPMIDRVLGALQSSTVESIVVATSPATPETHDHVDVPCIETAGDGYVPDLNEAHSDRRLGDTVLTVAADLPLLAAESVDTVVEAHDDSSLSVVVPVAFKEALGVSVDDALPGEDRWAPTGLNVVGDGTDAVFRSWDARLAVNVNREADAAVAEALAVPRKNYPT